MKRYDIINRLIETHGYKSYLEIGVVEGGCDSYPKIACEYKVGVDPVESQHTTHAMTSDKYFANYKDKFDIIFVDGLHFAEQVYLDIINSLNILNEGGTIVCHDMNPPSEIMQEIPRRSIGWTGDCWKAWVELRIEEENLSMLVVDTDYGCGIIQRGKQKLLEIDVPMTYDSLSKNRKEWLNLISVQEWLESL